MLGRSCFFDLHDEGSYGVNTEKSPSTSALTGKKWPQSVHRARSCFYSLNSVKEEMADELE